MPKIKMAKPNKEEVLALQTPMGFDDAVMRATVLYRKRTGRGHAETLFFLRLCKAQMDWASINA